MSSEKISPEEMIAMFTYKKVVNKPIEKIIEKMAAACEKYKFSLLQSYVYQEILEKKGFPIERKVFIYEICQAKIAAAMLTSYPHFSIFMPCKIAVYEEQGQTIISTMNMGVVLEALKPNPELYKDTTTLFETLKTLMDSISI